MCPLCGSPTRLAFPGASTGYVTCTRNGHVTLNPDEQETP